MAAHGQNKTLNAREMKYEFARVKTYLQDFQFNLKCLEYQKLKYPERSSEKSLQILNRCLMESVTDMQRVLMYLDSVTLELLDDEEDCPDFAPQKKKKRRKTTKEAEKVEEETSPSNAEGITIIPSQLEEGEIEAPTYSHQEGEEVEEDQVSEYHLTG